MGISIAMEPAESGSVRWCFRQYYEELDRRFEGGFDVGRALPLDADELTPPRGLVVIARREGQTVGCGAVKLDVEPAAEIKRMWVAESARGQGVGGRILDELERQAIEAGKTVTRLETNGTLVEAIAMYRRRGYREVAPFNDEIHADFWFEKDLSPVDRQARSSGG